MVLKNIPKISQVGCRYRIQTMIHGNDLVIYLVTVPTNITMTIPKTKHKKTECNNRKYIT
ncbi:hypothetical protein C0153_04400 [Moraxella catarrhalis]|nr:hypothetical protein [Moraxella catarrhalis]RKL89298.1 hypothetical protein D6D56_07975 [Moraxella catarrhalis]